jgi:hypothetical protein
VTQPGRPEPDPADCGRRRRKRGSRALPGQLAHGRPSRVRSTRNVARSRKSMAVSRSSASRAAKVAAPRTDRHHPGHPSRRPDQECRECGRSGRGRRRRSSCPSRRGPGNRRRCRPRGPASRGSTAGSTPNLARTPSSSVTVPARRSSWTTRSTDDALGQVLVGGADDDLTDAVVVGGHGGGRGQGVVGLQVDHGPDRDPEGL